MEFFYKRFGFTLAEVLITLGVIGIVAAMTLPSVINNIQNEQLHTSFKTAYSILSQAVVNMREEEGTGLRKSFTEFDMSANSYTRADEFYKKFYPYSKLQVIGECKYQGKIRNFNKTAEAYTSWSGAPSTGKENFKDLLSNGMCSSILINAAEINIAIDVNGTKAPNAIGHDIFYFNVNDNDVLTPRKKVRDYSDEELEDQQFGFVAGNPCSYTSKQKGNGVGCTYYALIDQAPDGSSKSYWKSLP